jgi:hypothetical protein
MTTVEFEIEITLEDWAASLGDVARALVGLDNLVSGVVGAVSDDKRHMSPYLQRLSLNSPLSVKATLKDFAEDKGKTLVNLFTQLMNRVIFYDLERQKKEEEIGGLRRDNARKDLENARLMLDLLKEAGLKPSEYNIRMMLEGAGQFQRAYGRKITHFKIELLPDEKVSAKRNKPPPSRS